ncbi:2Fe-2S iron-sulfur cluster-binding protein [Herbiconiux sp.]|uniref:MOSC domain-containing protein n=1 Tax=Herbiconiux sp. TaxID=1871186 RepID=UPI0025B8AFB4|nr:2Fe-2S iron-sulfur cluster-binding protein [Herbiconiux sp.]
MTAREHGDTPVTLARITRYPVKGLPGTSTASAAVAPGEGLGFDRVLAIETGDTEHVDGGGWRRRAAFHHVAKNPSLVRFETALEREGDVAAGSIDDPGAAVRLTVTGPNGATASIRFPDPDFAPLDEAVRGWFPRGRTGDATVVAPGARLWDWQNALISLINLETVAALQEHTGREVDDRRFRGNLLVSGLPAWSEFGLVGRTISIGEERFEVFQPTDRCRATAVDPLTGSVDLNVPARLAAHFGHMFCGVYLRPLTTGRIAVSDAVSVLPGGSRASAEAIAEWPRLAAVSRRESVTDGVESFWLDDSVGLLAGAGPGQHVRLHLPSEPSPNWRNYTISAVEGTTARITVKRIGGISTALHDGLEVGTELLVSGPFGPLHDVASTATTTGHPLVLVTAGIGITPAVAILRALAAEGSRAQVEMLHVDRTSRSVAHLDEVLDLLEALPNACLTMHVTGADPDAAAFATAPTLTADAGSRVRVNRGRPTGDDLAAAVDRAAAAGGGDRTEVTAHLCGPPGLLDDARRALERAGVARERIHFDVFYTPRLTDGSPRVPPRQGPFTVDPGDGGAPLEWHPADGALLDVAEADGRGWPSACRSGACGTCEGALRSGTVAYLVDPVVTPPDGRILTCCAVPTSDVVLGP